MRQNQGQNHDERRFSLGMNKDHSPEDVENFLNGEYLDALNVRVASSDEQQGFGLMETLLAEVELLIDASIPGYYGGAIGSQFIYEGYPEVAIGDQVWMGKNWDFDYPGSKVFNDDEENRVSCGGLYNWDMIQQGDFAPAGWRVPFESDFDELMSYLGGALVAGAKMKEAGLTHWASPNLLADNSSNFTALPCGMFDTIFKLLKEKATFWLKDADIGVLTDLDGNIYTEVVVGNQVWLIENLIVTKYADGTAIPNLTLDADWLAEDGSAGHNGGYCWYDNDPVTYRDYGIIYSAYAYTNAKGIAYMLRNGVHEEGWRVPTLQDWAKLASAIGGAYNAGGKMKETGLVHWNAPNTGATNESGFTALGGGYRNKIDASFSSIKEFAFFATSEMFDETEIYMPYLVSNSGVFWTTEHLDKNLVVANVRLVKSLSIDSESFILAGTSIGGLILRSVDVGITFVNEGSFNLGNPTSFARLGNGDIIYSTDQGRVINYSTGYYTYAGSAGSDHIYHIGAFQEVVVVSDALGNLNYSIDGGATFKSSGLNLGVLYGSSFIDETNVILITSTGIYNWTIDSATYSLKQAGGFSAAYTDSSSNIYAGDTDGHIWRSADGGESWADMGSFGSNKVNFIIGANGSRILFSCNTESISYTDDDFTTEINVLGIATSILCATHIADGVILIGDDTGDIWRSVDNGVSWDEIGGNPQFEQNSINCITNVLPEEEPEPVIPEGILPYGAVTNIVVGNLSTDSAVIIDYAARRGSNDQMGTVFIINKNPLTDQSVEYYGDNVGITITSSLSSGNIIMSVSVDSSSTDDVLMNYIIEVITL